jgi:uncharacterized protein YqjF (DUF2071 family)
MPTTSLRPFLSAEWRHLAMLNYLVEPAVLAPFVPAGTELDAWQGRTFVSVVGFLFLDTRVLGAAIPWHRDFEEVNLRFYVRRHAPDGLRRGVVFIKEIVPRWAIAATARLLYGEKYEFLPMRHSVPVEGAARPSHAEYLWRQSLWPRKGAWNRLRLVPSGEAAEAGPGSEEEFITEHYWGYSRLRGGGTVEYRVEHPRWRVWQAESARLECDATDLYGPQFAPALAGSPSSAFLADGSPVTVFRGERIA